MCEAIARRVIADSLFVLWKHLCMGYSAFGFYGYCNYNTANVHKTIAYHLTYRKRASIVVSRCVHVTVTTKVHLQTHEQSCQCWQFHKKKKSYDKQLYISNSRLTNLIWTHETAVRWWESKECECGKSADLSNPRLSGEILLVISETSFTMICSWKYGCAE